MHISLFFAWFDSCKWNLTKLSLFGSTFNHYTFYWVPIASSNFLLKIFYSLFIKKECIITKQTKTKQNKITKTNKQIHFIDECWFQLWNCLLNKNNNKLNVVGVEVSTILNLFVWNFQQQQSFLWQKKWKLKQPIKIFSNRIYTFR